MEAYSRDKSVTVLGTWSHSSGVWDGVPQAAFTSSVRSKLRRSLSGFKNPNWKSQVLNLQNATTPANGYYITFEEVVGGAKVIRKDHNGVNQPFSWKGSPPSVAVLTLLKTAGPDLWPTSVDVNIALNRAVISFLKRLRKTQVAFSAPTFLGELRESIDMIRHPAKGLSDLARSYIHRVKDAKKKSPRNWKGNLSSLWLEQAFGWQPLISDINSAHAAYKTLNNVKTKFVSGFGKVEILRPSTPNPNIYVDATWPGFMTSRITEIQKESAFVKLRGVVKREVQAPLVEKLSYFGFTPSEFLPTAWELLPWSFLIDYFVNIGDIIEANVTSRADIAWTDRSDVISKEYLAVITPFTKSEYNSADVLYADGSGATAKLDSRNWTRTPNVSLPSFSVPEFRIPGIWAPWANMTALFAQANAEIYPQRRWHR